MLVDYDPNAKALCYYVGEHAQPGIWLRSTDLVEAMVTRSPPPGPFFRAADGEYGHGVVDDAHAKAWRYYIGSTGR